MNPLDSGVNQFSSELNPLEDFDPLKDEMYIFEEESGKVEGENEISFKKADPNTEQGKIAQAITDRTLAIFSKITEGKTEIKTFESLASKIRDAKVINLHDKDNSIKAKISTKNVDIVVKTAGEINTIAIRIFQIIEMTNKRIKDKQEELEKERKELAEKAQAENGRVNKNVSDIIPQKIKKKYTTENNLNGRIRIINDSIGSELMLNEKAHERFKNKKANAKKKLEKLTKNHKIIENKYSVYSEIVSGVITEKRKNEDKNDNNPAS
jgi:hypothetical protein